MLPTPLRSPPPGVDEASAALTTLDDLLLGGLGRLADAQKDALRGLTRVFDGSPLGPLVAESVNAACSGPPQEAAMVGLAAAREALQGARADALAAQLDALLGRPAQEAPATAPVEAPAEALGLLTNARQWLVELGLAGLGQIEPGAVTAFDASLGELQLVSPAVLRPATLLTGFHQELLSKLPLAALTDAPRARWADLWSRALLACLPKQPRPSAEAVEGAKLSVFMLEAQHHRNMVSAVLWGVLDHGGEGRVVRATLSGWRVDALAGEESWWAVLRGFEGALREVSYQRALTVSGSLCSTGDLLLTRTTPGQDIDPAKVAAAAMALKRWPQVAPTDRHPAQLAAPVLINGAPSRVDGVLSAPLGDGHLPISFDRVSPLQGLDAATVAKSERLWGLVRWDAGAWSLQPLAAQAKGAKAPSGPWEGIASAVKTKSSTLANLNERAGKLLRKKS
jgi:hypothetical protein